MIHEAHRDRRSRRYEPLVPRGIEGRTAGQERLRPPLRAHHVSRLEARRRRTRTCVHTSNALARPTPTAPTHTDRTAYHETVPANQLEHALRLDSDPHGVPPRARRRADARRPAGRGEERAAAELRERAVRARGIDHPVDRRCTPAGHPYHEPAIGNGSDLDAADARTDVKSFFRAWYGPRRRHARHRGRHRSRSRRWRSSQKYFGPIAAGPVPERRAPPPVVIGAGRDASRGAGGRVAIAAAVRDVGDAGCSSRRATGSSICSRGCARRGQDEQAACTERLVDDLGIAEDGH